MANQPKPHDTTGRTTWIVFAGGHRAQVYRVEDHRWINAERVRELDHPQTRMQAPDLVTDDVGRRSDRFAHIGPGLSQRSGMDPKTSLKEQEKQAFAHEIAAFLDEGRQSHAFDELLVFASPEFLGTLRAAMPKNLEKTVAGSVDKDLTWVSAHDIGKRLHKEMHAGEEPGEPYSTGMADHRLRDTKRR